MPNLSSDMIKDITSTSNDFNCYEILGNFPPETIITVILIETFLLMGQSLAYNSILIAAVYQLSYYIYNEDLVETLSIM